MGEIADDCYDRAEEELAEREADPFYGCGPERDLFSARPLQSRSLSRGVQRVGRPQRQLPLEVPENRDWKFIAIEKTWPFGSRDFLVQQPDLKSAIKDFYTNEYHKPFRNDKPVPDYHIDVQIQTTGGWIVYGEEQTVLIFCR
ncbi:hypothetical protein D3C75_948990 [compost metagenome]